MLRSAMLFRFDGFEFDTVKVELRANGTVRPLEPQVFALLAFLLEHRERLVSRDELLHTVWQGREVSDAALSSRIKSVRRALGDDGKAQRLVKTLQGQGLRFVGSVECVSPAEAESPQTDSRPSIAVAPFRFVGTSERLEFLAEALPRELTVALARVRWLVVSSSESSTRAWQATPSPGEATRSLGVRYCLSGSVEVAGAKLTVMVELFDARRGTLVWGERFSGAVRDVHAFRVEMAAKALAAIELHLPRHEADLARHTPTEHLDAWGAFHRALHHLYRFERADNEVSATLFRQALTLDPHFARAQAGLSCTHFMKAFLAQTDSVEREIDLARRHATLGLELDALDPFVSFAMGRTFWLEGDLETALTWLDRATSLSPSYAHGVYARSWTETLLGDVRTGRRHVDFAMRLSPFDPMSYGMLGTRALGHLIAEEDAEALRWVERAAHAPNAHALVGMLAVAVHALAGDGPKAADWAGKVLTRAPRLRSADFFRAFPMRPAAARRRVLAALSSQGF
jgi:DNA-binding winged helix-turn-helix (wHTH) protein